MALTNQQEIHYTAFYPLPRQLIFLIHRDFLFYDSYVPQVSSNFGLVFKIACKSVPHRSGAVGAVYTEVRR